MRVLVRLLSLIEDVQYCKRLLGGILVHNMYKHTNNKKDQLSKK